MSCPGNCQCAYEELPMPCPTHKLTRPDSAPQPEETNERVDTTAAYEKECWDMDTDAPPTIDDFVLFCALEREWLDSYEDPIEFIRDSAKKFAAKERRTVPDAEPEPRPMTTEPFTDHELEKYRRDLVEWEAAGRPDLGAFGESTGTMMRETARWLATIRAHPPAVTQPEASDTVNGSPATLVIDGISIVATWPLRSMPVGGLRK